MHGQGVELHHVEADITLAKLGLVGIADGGIGRVSHPAVAAKKVLFAEATVVGTNAMA